MKLKKITYEITALIITGFVIIIVSNWIFYTGRQINELIGERKAFLPEPTMEFGIITDSLSILKNEIKPGENISQLLGQHGLTGVTIDKLVKKCEGVFDLRRIKAGNPYTLMVTRDTSNAIQYFIYEESPLKYIIFDLRDTLAVSFGEKEVLVTMDSVVGEIKSSRWNALTTTPNGIELATEMENIYGWVVDFFGLQPGDHFGLLYEKLTVEGKPMGVGKILAASFTTSGKTFQAYYYRADSSGIAADYFDEKGQSLRRAFLKAPLKFSRISSRFSGKRYHPVLKIYRPHHGVDYAAPIGTPVFSIGAGTVLDAGFQRSGAGRFLKIRHNSTYTTVYMHLNGYAKGIKSGIRVNQGDLIAYVGRTGLATGPHLDFRVYKNGYPIDPLKMESPPAKPISPSFLKSYLTSIHQRKIIINQLGKR